MAQTLFEDDCEREQLVSIEEIDSNFKPIEMDGVKLVSIDVADSRAEMSGLPWFEAERKYCRLSQASLPALSSEGVRVLARHTAGAMLRFRSDSPSLGINAVLGNEYDMSHMPRSGSGGFDLYEGAGARKKFVNNLKHEYGSNEVKGLFCRGLKREVRDLTIYLPLYNSVKSLELAFEPGSILEKPAQFAYEKPVLFYGSSITQGGCASRPGNAYPAIITRRLDARMINFGFSGNAKGEPELAEIIASLDLSAFVLDYDHNAPTVEHLQKTHEPFFKIIRKARPNLPIVIVSRISAYDGAAVDVRRQVIRETWKRAGANGDERVFFVDGDALLGETERDMCTVDGCHPNDIGFLRMADGLMDAVRTALS